MRQSFWVNIAGCGLRAAILKKNVMQIEDTFENSIYICLGLKQLLFDDPREECYPSKFFFTDNEEEAIKFSAIKVEKKAGGIWFGLTLTDEVFDGSDFRIIHEIICVTTEVLSESLTKSAIDFFLKAADEEKTIYIARSK